MICSKCGQECTDADKFCTNCGAEFAEEVNEPAEENTVTGKATEGEPAESAKEPEAAAEDRLEKTEAEATKEKKEKKPVNKKVVVAVAAVFALFLLVLLIAGVCAGGTAYVTAGKYAIVEIGEVEDKVLVLYASGKIDELNYEEGNNIVYSQDYSTAVFVNEDEELILIRNGKVIETGIEDAENVTVSVYGDTIAYLSDVELDTDVYESVGILNLYYTKSGKTKKIAEDVLDGSIVLSPNGQTVAFVSDYDAKDDFRGYYSVKGKEPVSVGKENYVIAIADKAAYIYYRDDDRLYAQKKKKEAEKLVSGLSGVSVLVNADCTELMYTVDGKTYLSVKAGEKEKISSDSVTSIVLPEKALQEYQYYYTPGGRVYVSYTGVETLEEQLYWTEGDISFLNGRKEMKTVASSVEDCVVAEDGESLVYIDRSGDVNRVTKFAKGGETKKIKDDAEAVAVYAAGDLKYVYYVNEDDELFCIKGTKAKKLADDVTDVAVSGDGTRCYYVIEREQLCYSKKNGKKKNILSEEDGSISLYTGIGFVSVNVRNEDDDRTIYHMDGTKLNEIYHIED